MLASKKPAPLPEAIGPYRVLGVEGVGGMAVVYRAERAGSPERVAIKTVRAPHESHVAGIRREIHALMHVRHPGIVRILDEGVQGGLPWYAMELLEGRTLADDIRAVWAPVSRGPPVTSQRRIDIATLDAPTGAQWAGPERIEPPAGRAQAGGADLPHVLQVMRELCETLAFLHGEGIIHRDLKPANVFLRDGVEPVLVDFGIAWRFPTAVGREVFDLPLFSAGTIGYVAPEQIGGQIVDARADLYSVGCILYQAITGSLPFEAASDGAILWAQRFKEPTPPSELVDGVSLELGELILRLLEKQPRDRIGHAGDVARALAAIGAPRRPGYEPKPARACVYRPGLAGRGNAMAELEAHVERLVGGVGGCVLVRGESGIGKTHLTMAIARAAAARNLEVIAAACSPVVPGKEAADRGDMDPESALAVTPSDAALHVFQPLLRTIADRCVEGGAELSKALLGDRAKLLAVCEPALAHLPGLEDTPEPPELPARAAHERILRCVAETIAAFSQKWPLLLVLDDLQWADELSLELLASLSRDYFSRNPVLVVGTYRVEQPRARLEELGAGPGVAQIDLGKLDKDSVAAMVGDMLAMSPPPEPLVCFLSLRSEGNPFFVAEYVRAAVAEDLLTRSSTGRWQLAAAAQDEHAYERLPLPASIRDLVGHRVSGLSAAARGLLEMASVLGREVEWDLLSAAAAIPERQALDASRELVARHIVEEAAPGRLRFLHDKLREGAHDRIPAARRAELHGAAGRAIEARSAAAGDFPLLYGKLARHYTEAGDAGKAIEYLEKAGEQALKTWSYREAAGLFRELIALDTKAEGDRATEEGRLKRARRERRLAEITMALGDLKATLEHARRALWWSDHRLPRSQLGWILRLLREIPVQAAHRIGSGPRGAQASEPRAGQVEASLALAGIAHGYLFSDVPRAFAAGLWSMNIAERAGGDAKLARAYAVLGTGLGFLKLPGAARRYFVLARDTAERTRDEAGLVTSLYIQGYWLQSRGGEWDAARTICGEAIDRARRLGDLHEIEAGELLIALTNLISGRFEESRRQYEALARGAARRVKSLRLVMSLLGLSSALLRLGALDEAEARLEEALALMEREGSPALKLRCVGLLAGVHVRRGDLDRAIACADRVSADLDHGPMMLGLGMAYGCVADVYLARASRAIEGGDGPAELAEALRATRRIVQRLRIASLLTPIAAPTFHRIQGRMRWLEGARAAAKRSWARALAAAIKLDLPFEQALARLDLARAEPPGSGAREQHLDVAEALCAAMGCRSELAEIESLRA